MPKYFTGTLPGEDPTYRKKRSPYGQRQNPIQKLLARLRKNLRCLGPRLTRKFGQKPSSHTSYGVNHIVIDILQVLFSEFQMTGANHYVMTLIQSKAVQFSFSSESLWKIDRCKWGFLKIDGCNCTRCTCSNGDPVKQHMFIVFK